MEIVLGPPGTGKTTYLLEQMERELDRGVPPERISFVSFTKRAATEAKTRAVEKFALTEKDMPWVSTLHSMCFRSLGLKPEQVLQGEALRAFSDWLDVKLSTGSTLTSWLDGALDEESVGFLPGDRTLTMDNLARVQGITFSEQHGRNSDGLVWQDADELSRSLAVYKQDMGLFDYTDMLAQFVERGGASVVRPEVLIVDEAQDLSMLQWRVVGALAKSARRVVVAGDDDQAIYRWAGAAVDHFIGLPGDVTVLGHSWRVPPEVQDVALRVARRIAHRRPKKWAAREGSGSVMNVGTFGTVPVDVNEDTLILARNKCFLRDDVRPSLMSNGILYEYLGEPSVRQNVIDAIVAWERLRRGGTVTVTEAEGIYDQMSVGEGYVRGHKKLPAWPDREQMVTLSDLKQAGGLKTDAIWHEALTRVRVEERVYMVAVLKGGQKLTERPKVKVSTIHGAKGGQADHVILLTDVAPRTMRAMKADLVVDDDEARVWYVAATRTKQMLTIVAPQNTRRAYRL